MHLFTPNPMSLPGTVTVLLAPSSTAVPPSFRGVQADADGHAHLLAEVQRLRGRVYLADGAITESQLTVDGRHVQAADACSWHVVMLSPDGRVTGCARYQEHAPGTPPEALGVWRSALARDAHWHEHLRAAVCAEMEIARQRGVAFVELGGWAVAEECRGTSQALDIALSTFALSGRIGGAIGLTTATVRHASSRMLRKLGGRPLVDAGMELPAYHDAQYECMMEILRFDSDAPGSRFAMLLHDRANTLETLPTVVPTWTSAVASHAAVGFMEGAVAA